MKQVQDFIKQSKRVLKVTQKPDSEEFWMITKVSLIGIGLLGTIGYIMFALSQDSLLGLPITAGIATAILAYFILQ